MARIQKREWKKRRSFSVLERSGIKLKKIDTEKMGLVRIHPLIKLKK